MSEVLQANIFFFITGIAVIVFTVLLCVLLYHLIRIVKLVRKVIERIEIGSEIIAEDMAHFRTYFKEESLLSRFVKAVFGGGAERSKSKPAKPRLADLKPKTELKIKDED